MFPWQRNEIFLTRVYSPLKQNYVKALEDWAHLFRQFCRYWSIRMFLIRALRETVQMDCYEYQMSGLPTSARMCLICCSHFELIDEYNKPSYNMRDHYNSFPLINLFQKPIILALITICNGKRPSSASSI